MWCAKNASLALEESEIIKQLALIKVLVYTVQTHFEKDIMW